MHWIRSLSDITVADIEAVGSKAAHLGALHRAGFPVPEGFVIEVSAFIDHFGHTTDSLVRPSVPRLQSELMAEVVQATVDYLGAETELAVRSSSTEEDASHASFAGLHSTYYFVNPTRLDQAIIDCWMSLWSNAALAYRRQGWTDVASGEPVRMAVIVQRMLNATRSGVVFSKDPIEPTSRSCIVEASWGLGAVLADGRVTPDQARLSDAGELLSYTVNNKTTQVVASPSNPDASRVQEVPADLRNAPVLTTAEAESIANTALQLETLFDQPQDVEWAYTGDEFWILQSRPITTLLSSHHIERRLVLFKPLAENFTEPLTPMSEDLFARALPKVGATFEGRFYLDFDVLRRLMPFKLTTAQAVDLALLRAAPESYDISWPRALQLAATSILGFVADGANWIRTARLTHEQTQHFVGVAQRVLHNTSINPPAALRKLVLGALPVEPIYRQVFLANISAGRYFLLIGVLKRLVARFAPDYPLAQLSRVYHGHEDMQSLELLKRLHRLARTLTQDEALRETITEYTDAQTSNPFMLPPAHPFTREFEQFMHDFGHRGQREIELAAPRWRETPAAVLNLLMSTDAEIGSERLNNHGSHLAARDELNQHLRPWQRRIVGALLRSITRYITLRENTRHFHVMTFDVVRQKLLKLEQQLIEDRRLKLTGDIFFLRWHELEQLEAHDLSPQHAHERIRQRRREFQRRARTRPLETVNIEFETPTLESNQNDAALVGQCASPGATEGIARVILSLNDADRLGTGEILVAPYTDPAWTPLFTRAAAVVVATGSFLSHAGTVARELHIPCVVDVRDCTSQIRSGQTVRVDAVSGVVEIMDPKAAQG